MRPPFLTWCLKQGLSRCCPQTTIKGWKTTSMGESMLGEWPWWAGQQSWVNFVSFMLFFVFRPLLKLSGSLCSERMTSPPLLLIFACQMDTIWEGWLMRDWFLLGGGCFNCYYMQTSFDDSSLIEGVDCGDEWDSSGCCCSTWLHSQCSLAGAAGRSSRLTQATRLESLRNCSLWQSCSNWVGTHSYWLGPCWQSCCNSLAPTGSAWDLCQKLHTAPLSASYLETSLYLPFAFSSYGSEPSYGS